MKRFTELDRHLLPLGLVILTFGSYAVIFMNYHNQVGMGVAALATIPVIVAGWYFGIGGGISVSFLSIVTTLIFQSQVGLPNIALLAEPGNILRIVSLFLVAILTGSLSTLTRQHQDALIRLEQYEKDQESHTMFLEGINRITARALEADSLQSTLDILTEKIANSFHADDVFFAFWDETHQVPIPAAAYGSMSDTYPHMQFEPAETSPTSAAMKAGHPIPIEDVDASPHINSRVAALFPSRSMLGIPLITQRRKLGAIFLGYNRKRSFDEKDIFRAEVVAEQVALVLSKAQLLEDERKQVRQLSALHDVALTAVEAGSEDELIERVTDIIGKNLFPDNFGILLLDGSGEYLLPHPSYRSYKTENLELKKLPLGTGITGQVAKTGQLQRIGDVRRAEHYLIMDDRTVSELCVPIKIKEQMLGVINAESTNRDAFSPDDERLLVTLAGLLATALEQLRRAEAERKWLDQLAHSNDLIYSIAQITTQIDRSLSTDQLVQSLGNELEGIGLTCIMAVYDEKRSSFTVNYTSLQPRFLETVEAGLGYPLLQYSFPRQKLEAVLGAEEVLRPAVILDPEEEIVTFFTRINRRGIARVLRRIGVMKGMHPMRLPLVFEENLLGILWVWGKDIYRSDLPILSIFAKQIGISLERAHLFQEVQSLALRDPLTGLLNRRSIFELGEIEFTRAVRMERPFCCMMLDLDHFKGINDRYGHLVGDQVLQEFARHCLGSVRAVDLVGRYGGEEFIILMPETDRQMALQVAERLRTMFSKKSINISDVVISATISIGVAGRDENTSHLEALIARADQALYIAKHKGRDRVAISV